MPVPKTKSSRSRRDKRRANWKLTVPGLVECPQCHAMKKPHHVCPVCGFYKGKQVITKTEDVSPVEAFFIVLFCILHGEKCLYML